MSKYIPAFAAVKVGVESETKAGQPMLSLVPTDRSVSIEDLMRHTASIPVADEEYSMIRTTHIWARFALAFSALLIPMELVGLPAYADGTPVRVRGSRCEP